MDSSIAYVKEKKIERVIDALNKNNMNGYLVNSKDELIDKIKELVKEGSKVACGGSMTLFETGVIEHLRSNRYDFLDRYEEGLTGEEIKNIFRQSFFSDAYFASSNAITESGEIYNVDGNGNRVAAILYGPDKVIIVAGINKIVKDLDEAIKRNRAVSAPANAKRLNKATPCTRVGYCMDCKSPDRICREYTVIKSQGDKDRIHVIFLNEELGY
ncbi:lactate utilization protein [Clostridium sp. 'White wine YQ']|uniref:lactate utilization protein n=1 Tax=Clostridium sp. 'White wine YQ' TaxID=3027474 RepID=UPI0023661862|nr:lactate utilization protein [Clostridium sp. 'White wine YQ']MDD7796277.1 lactate utilization protein [Clostridium sp. 'White wine YQ']